jgi:hypothetical protein
MKYVIQKKYTDAEWASFIHHPERENDWEDYRGEILDAPIREYDTKEEAEWFLKFWKESKHTPKGILLRMVER